MSDTNTASPGPEAGTDDGNGRVAIITAAADGIGQSTAAAFAAAGYRLVLVDINESSLRATAADLGLSGDEVEVRTTDVTDEQQVNDLVAAVMSRFGRIDVLVNVVGGSRPGKTAIELTLDEWQQLLALNLTSTFLTCKAVLPHMQAAGSGHIVNVSSGAGLRGMHANPGYCAAKAGVVALTRALAIDHMPHGVRVNCVAPGPIRTPLMRRNRTPDEIAAMGGLSLSGRIGEPGEIASAILWLASDASSYVVGQCIEVDGGVASAV
jgi:NAD(P)-dependent dehydrogenase (short-subunit alcohol dehydrogenase family)